ncbi:hypothetical protein JCM14036_03230 [Desulfotomaculum defluvii]
MANPQPEQFTRISNELYTAIMQTNFSKRQRKILDLVIRMSYGCGKKYAILRPQDFVDLVGIHKTDIREELDVLLQAEVLFIDENNITLNKDYECWRVGMARSINTERWNEVLSRNLEHARVGKIPIDDNKVGKIPTTNWCFTNYPVGKIPTTRDTGANQYKACQPPKEKVKENIKEMGIPPQPPHKGTDGQATTEDILTRFPRYTSRQTDKILDYWQMIGRARNNRTISPSIVAKQMNYWERFPVGIVIEAIELHLEKYRDKQENYTAGIMRGLVKEKGESTNGTHRQSHRPFVIDRSKFLFNGGKDV